MKSLALIFQNQDDSIELKKSEYNELQMQIKDLRIRMNEYEKLLNRSLSLHPMPKASERIRPEFFQSLNVEIVDFSPEWDYITGGSKILVCINISFEQYLPLLPPDAFSFQFETICVPATFLQGSVLKCFAPPHKPAFVPFYLIYDGVKIATARMGTTNKMFEYRTLRVDKKKKKAISFLRPRPESDLDQENKEYKIKLIERLSSLEFKLSQDNQKQSHESETIVINGQEYTILSLRELSNEQLDLLTHVQFVDISTKLFKKLKEKFGVEETAKLINEKDSSGCALIHYIAALNYYELIEVLKSYGAELDIKTTNENLTPLVISAAKGNKKTLSKLLSFGANEEEKSDAKKSKNKSIQQLNPVQIAVERKYHGILELLLRDITLKDAMSGESNENYTNPCEIKRRIEQSTIPRRGLGSDMEFLKVRSFSRESLNSSKMKFEELNNFVLKIQRNVKEWLLRRHYKDIKQASKILHSTLEERLGKRDIDKRTAAIMIQRTVRAWLNVKNELSNE